MSSRSLMRQLRVRCWRAMAYCKAASCLNFSFLTQGALIESSFWAFSMAICLSWIWQTASSYYLVVSISNFSFWLLSAFISFLAARLRASSSLYSPITFILAQKLGRYITFTLSTSANCAPTCSIFSWTVLASRSSNFSLPRVVLFEFCICLFQCARASRCESMAWMRGAFTASLPPAWIQSTNLQSNPVSLSTSFTTSSYEMVGSDSRCRSISSRIRWHSVASMLLREEGSSCLTMSAATLSRLRPSRQCSISPRSLVKLKPSPLRKERMRSKEKPPYIV